MRTKEKRPNCNSCSYSQKGKCTYITTPTVIDGICWDYSEKKGYTKMNYEKITCKEGR